MHRAWRLAGLMSAPMAFPDKDTPRELRVIAAEASCGGHRMRWMVTVYPEPRNHIWLTAAIADCSGHKDPCKSKLIALSQLEQVAALLKGLGNTHQCTSASEYLVFSKACAIVH